MMAVTMTRHAFVACFVVQVRSYYFLSFIDSSLTGRVRTHDVPPEIRARSHFVRHLLHDCKGLPVNEADAAELVAQREKRIKQRDSEAEGHDNEEIGEVTIERLRATVAQFVATSHCSARIVENSSLRQLLHMAQVGDSDRAGPPPVKLLDPLLLTRPTCTYRLSFLSNTLSS